VPHLTLLLDVDPAEGARRRKKDIPDRLEKEGLEFQDRVRRGYMELSRQQPARIKVIDAGMARTDVMAQAMPYLKAVL